MEMTINYSACPVCGSTGFSEVLQVIDHSVTGKEFAVCECYDCHFRFTQKAPDRDSIAPYYQSEEYISHSDTQKGWINRIYHWVRRITLTSKRKLVEKMMGRTKGHLLDIGAGTGAFASYMITKGWEVTGLEPDEKARKVAAATHKIQLLPADELFSLPEKQFDAITLWHVLEHVHQLKEYLEQIQRLLKPGGGLFIAVPNYTSYDALRYNRFWAAYDVPRHLYHFSPEAMKVLVERNGWKLLAVKPMWFDSFYVSMLSEKFVSGKNNLLKGAWVGAISNIKAFANKEKCSSLIYCITGK